MPDQVTQAPDHARLADEIGRLRRLVADLEQRVAQLDQLAHQDVLIALPNRRGFMRELERLIARVARYGGEGAMLFVDLDGLKSINDTFGHQAGDLALIQVAALLSTGVRESDVVARIGGDEFGILLERANQGSAHDTAARLGALICDCELRHDGEALPLSVAIGVAMIDGNASPAQVIAEADADMYRRKALA